MAKTQQKKPGWSIVTKITLLVCGVVLVLVLAGSAVLFLFEHEMFERFRQEHVGTLNRTLEDRNRDERDTLREYMTFIGQVLSDVGAEFVFQDDEGALHNLFTQYLKHPAIAAIAVRDQNNAPITATWKMYPLNFQGNALPNEIISQNPLSLTFDVVYYSRKIGFIQLYYSDVLLNNKLTTLKANVDISAKIFSDTTNRDLQRVLITQGISIGVALLLLMACLLIFLQVVIRKPLVMLVNIAYTLKGFDLTLNLQTKRRDEIGRVVTAVNDMVQSFRSLIAQVQQSGIQVTASATELSATAKQQEVIITTQAESTRNVVRSAEEISELTSHLAETMQHVAILSQTAADLAGSGHTDLTRMEDAMHRMEDASQSISTRLHTIREKAENITTVVTTITKVADQTNLLSLNAAIEAEKAGEYGRGFTVVATEIRRLADQTAVATLDIEQMVQEMQAAVSSGMQEIEQFISEVRQSAEDVSKISTQMTDIIEQVQALSPEFDEVNVGMEHQKEHSHTINTAIQRLSEEMQETKMSLQETFSAIGQLNEAARSLHDEVSRFKVN